MISQGNSTAVESVTFDIALGCPVLGVMVKPEGKALQKKDL